MTSAIAKAVPSPAPGRLPAATPRYDQTNLRNSPKTTACLQNAGVNGGALGGRRCRARAAGPRPGTNDLNHCGYGSA